MAQKRVEDSKVIEIYNAQGKSGAIDFIKTTYGIKNAYCVLQRLKSNDEYIYDPDTDIFRQSMETPFMELDELCVESREKIVTRKIAKHLEEPKELQYDRIVQEMINDRFMEYARFIQSNSYERTWRVNKTALQAAGYQLELY